MGKYHRIKEDGYPTEDGRYMVKVMLDDAPIWDNMELCFREFKNGQFDAPYYSDPKTDQLVGWFEND